MSFQPHKLSAPEPVAQVSMKAGVWAPGITPLPSRPRGVGECRGPSGKAFALLSATASGGCGVGLRDTRPAESGAVAGGNRSAERSRAVSPGVGAERADRAAGCGALGCRETQHLWRVSAGGQRRVLCAVHAVRWLQREGAALCFLPMPTLPPLRRQIQASEALRRQFRVKT
jgi:hypothetical protein